MFLGKRLLYSAQKGGFAGAEGILAYFIPDMNQTLAVLYSVPLDTVLYDNLFDVRLVAMGKRRADKSLWEWMYNKKKAFKGDDTWHHRNLGSGLRVRGAMSRESSLATIEIAVMRQ